MTSAPVRLAAFGGALLLVLLAAFAVGAVAEPLRGAADTGAADTAADGHEEGEDMNDENGAPAVSSAATASSGLAVSAGGYTLAPADTTLTTGAVPFRFVVTGPDGEPLTSYRETHERDLHLIVVSRDLASFQHVHPTLGEDGTWSVELDLRAPGVYRAFADFAPAGGTASLTLGADLFVAGDYSPAPLAAQAPSASVDGYDVRLSGQPVAGGESDLTFTVTRNGDPVDDLEPYLGAFGHLVSLRAGDLAYLHTHPHEDARPGDRGGPAVPFTTEFPTAGTYRLFLDFQAGGAVHTAAFTVVVGGRSGVAQVTPAPSPSSHGH